MANVTVTATQVRALPQALTRMINAGEAMTTGVGKVVQVEGDGDVAMANATAAAGANGVLGIIVAGERHDKDGDIASGERVTMVVWGPVYLGESAALDETKVYFVGETDGLITDTAPAHFRAIGYPISSTVLFFAPVTTEAGS